MISSVEGLITSNFFLSTPSTHLLSMNLWEAVLTLKNIGRVSGPNSRTYSPVGCLYAPVTGVFNSTKRDILNCSSCVVTVEEVVVIGGFVLS